MDDPADIWTIDNSLNTLSDRPGMDSQKTDTAGFKYFKEFDQFELQSFTSATDTFVIFSYDADWGNQDSHAPYTYDYFSETLRERQSFNQEVRLVSKDLEQPFRWVFAHRIYLLRKPMIEKMMGFMVTPQIHMDLT